MNQMDLFADEAAQKWASEVERETSTASLELPEETSSSPVNQSSEAERQPSEGADLELPQDSVASSAELQAPEDQTPEGQSDSTTDERAAESQGAEALAEEFPEDIPQEADTETRIAMGDQTEGGGLQNNGNRFAEPDGTPPSLPDIEFPEDQQGQYQDRELPQDLRADYRDSIGEQQPADTGWQSSPSDTRTTGRQPQPIELPGDFDERLRFAIQPELDQLQDALGSRTADIIAENAVLASLSVVPE